MLHDSLCGPALKTIATILDTTHNSELRMSIDTVFACQLDFWPPEAADWLTRTRQWPSQDVVDQIRQQPCFLVHKPPSTRPEDMDKWSLSFTLAEQMLCLRRSEGMKLTYFCFKAIFYTCLHVKVDDKEISSYLCKTVMMWALEELPPEQWTEENLLTNLSYIFGRLFRHIELRHMPHYFIPEMNIMWDLPESIFNYVDSYINKYLLVSNPLRFLPGANIADVVSCWFQYGIANHALRVFERELSRMYHVMGWKQPNHQFDQEIISCGPLDDLHSLAVRDAMGRACGIFSTLPRLTDVTTEREHIRQYLEESLRTHAMRFESEYKAVECMLQKESHRE